MMVVVLLAGVAFGEGRNNEEMASAQNERAGDYAAINLNDLRQHPERYDGQRVTLTAEIVSISANYGSLHLFDEQSRALINVTLDQVKRSTRRSLVQDPIYRIAVFGRVNLDRGQLVVRAEKVELVSTVFVASSDAR
jgi:hypothetical protein